MFPIYLCLVLFILFSQFYHSPPTQSNNIYYILYDILFEIHIHKPFNKYFLLFGFVDNTFITMLMLQILLFVFVVLIFFMAFTFSIYNNNNNNCLYYLEFRACKLHVYALSIIFYVQRYSYALLVSLKCYWASDFDILFVVGSYLSGWYILARRRQCTLIYIYVAAVDISRLKIPRGSFLFCPTFLGSWLWISLWVILGDFLRLGGASRLGDGCGVLRLSGVGAKWESRARKGGGVLWGACLRGGVDGSAALRDKQGGGVNRGLGSAPLQVEGCVPSCFIRCFRLPSSSASYTQLVSSSSFDAPGTMRRMFWARFFMFFWSGAPSLRFLSHHAMRSLVGIWSSEFLTTFPIKVYCHFASWYRMVGILKNSFRRYWFVIFLSITIVILILINFLTFLWRNTSNLFNVASIIAQLSHPHRSKLQGIAQKIKYF